MFGLGTIVNFLAAAVGGIIGSLIKKGISSRVEQSLFAMIGVSVAIIGLNGVISSMFSVNPQTGRLSDSGGLLLLASLVIGVFAGEALRIDERLEGFGRIIEARIHSDGFAKGFISASLLFCVGGMWIIGSLNDGLKGDSSVLLLKSAIDFVAAIVLASALGIGVAFSGISVLIYQGSLTIGAGIISPLISPELLASICMVGYAIVFCIGLNLLGILKVNLSNLIPALFVPIVWNMLSMLKYLW